MLNLRSFNNQKTCPTLEPGGATSSKKVDIPRLAIAFISEVTLLLIVLVFAVNGTNHKVVHGLKGLDL